MPASSRRGKVKKRSKKSGKRAVEKPESPRPKFGEQERVEEAKFRPVRALREVPIEPGDLPDSYDETRVVLLPVDPYLAHVYWEVAPGELEKAKSHLGEDAQQAQATLRFYDITHIIFDGSNAHSFFDVDIELQARNWYVHLWSPEKSYYADLGFRTEDGRFVPIAQSNVAEIPRAWPLGRGEERYMLVTGNYERVEIIPPPSPFKGEGMGGGVNSAEILRRKLAEFYRFRRWGKPPLQPELPPTQSIHAPPEEERYVDLTELSERQFTAGVSSLERLNVGTFKR